MAFGLEEFAERLPDAAAILSHTTAVHRVVNRTDAAMEGIEQTWLRLSQPGVYSVTGDEVVFTALQPARTATSDLVETATELSEAMASYADEIDSLKGRYTDLKARVDSFDAEHPWTEKADWNDDDEAVAEHNVLASESARLLADLDQAQRDAANRIAAISGSSRRYSEGGDGEEIGYGRSPEDRVAGMGGPMEDGDFWLVDWWEWTGRNRERVWDAGNEVRERVWDTGKEVRERVWDTIKDGFVPGIPNKGPRFRDGKGSAGGKDFADTYSPNGRDPAHQPQVGDPDGGNGSFQDIKPRSINGAPEQQYITGIDRIHETQAREYVVHNKDGVGIAFDGHTWRGDPPVEVFQEVKGHLDFLDNIKPALLTKRLDEMVTRELVPQIDALKHSGTPGYVHELVFTEKVVMDTFEQVMKRYPLLRKDIVVRFEPMP
ncbi:hypothetical protein [Arthrobacter sp. zg-Y1110]|uniref:hypothetical protein n=1 Tax=Arthrobacter sp. zg-Y1110 TaxID=2886932 RepID=UPI001D15CB45|nr:hypothetical protein [Arthrobacter sp. zg-Y1110]MCC3291492.1 hypothetical protein [Arthrobacter sp. zg-Y1110]UWX83904.1 hypothetical protein N2K99_10345 [Arthrobacter sp. zg-Y1110]